MRSILLQITVALSSVLSSTASSLSRNISSQIVPIGNGGVLKIPVHRRNTSAQDPGSHKRQISTGLLNPLYGLAYYVEIAIGAPAQSVVVTLDTGSNELWVNPDCSTALSTAQSTWCLSNPVYNSGASSTAIDEDVQFDLEYGKGSAQGEYLEDIVWVGGVQVPNSIFGDASTSTDMAAGIWGVCFGYPLNTVYYTVLDLMYLDSIINSRAFSLDLMSVDTAEGAIIFGGIDTGKYIGSLSKCPIIPADSSPDGASRYWIYMSSFGVTRGGVSHTLSTPTYEQAVYLDSGTTLTFLPTNIVTILISYFPEAVAETGGTVWNVPCSLRDEASTIDFGFGSTTIRVPLHEAIWEPSPGSTTCIFGIGASDSNWVLGDTMLRGAYVVYDQDNSNLLLAQAANCGTNIIPIGSGANAVPSSTGLCTSTTITSSTSSAKSTSSTSSKVSTTSSGKTSTTSTSSKPTSSSSSSKAQSSSSSLSTSKSSTSSTSSKPTSSSTSLSSSKSSTSSVLSSSSSKITSVSSSSTKSSSTTSPTSTSTSTSKSSISSTSVSSSKSSSLSSSSSAKLTSSSAVCSPGTITPSTITVTSISTTTLKTKTITSTLSTLTITSISTKKTVTVTATGTCTAVGQVF